VIHLKGIGKSFSSGNDLGNFTQVPPEVFMDPAKRKAIIGVMGDKLLNPFVLAFIQCKKPIVVQV
jgi:enoyl-CoA hydratase/carnithine racemase